LIEVSGIKIPDSKIAREATELVRDAEGDLLFHHSIRVYFWAAIIGERKDLQPDRELLYIAAMFHDMGITPRYRDSQLRFEVDGANAAREFLRSHGIPEADVQKVWNAIALHTTPGIPEHMEPEIALVQAGAGLDIAGRGFETVPAEQREAVVAAFPRGGQFATDIIDTFYEGLKHRPASTFGTFNDDFLAFKDPSFRRGDMCSIILASPWTQ
jgi:hypothetical protein